MLTQAPVSNALQQIVDRILSSRQITREDQYSLLALRDLTAQECALVNRLFDRLRLGFIRVVD
jgi:hypothetical protein